MRAASRILAFYVPVTCVPIELPLSVLRRVYFLLTVTVSRESVALIRLASIFFSPGLRLISAVFKLRNGFSVRSDTS